MAKSAADYSSYVRHPRFGQAPRFTGLDPDPASPDVFLHWNTRPNPPYGSKGKVPGTAIPANLGRQTCATIPVTHYYDVDVKCRDCGLRFIFFAVEQKHWYEELGFPLEAQAVRCQPCRRHAQTLSVMRSRYEQLSQLPERTTEETLEMADCCLALIDEEIFSPKQLQHARALLNQARAAAGETGGFRTLQSRIEMLEARFRRQLKS